MNGAQDETATLWFLVRQVAARMDRAGDALYRGGLGLSLAQFLVLSVVDAHPGPLNQKSIAARLGLTKGTVSRQIDSAVAAGFMIVEPAPHSRRENAVRLTPSGEALVRKGDALLAESLRRDMPQFSPDELSLTVRTLSALNAALGGDPVPEWNGGS
ncbi:MarR family winged helix-turn-helix transcriptional regulator [Microbacterium sp. KUDC0406]|uniref:MarR family winged helix-turn-helix transcriptional regulator n=1 Tax=Microbacterium sp. KUDC0406 TaxID=2909588 RepID=UPI001F3FAA5C|nr:MarR family winged helix-turn-helix transcriptional regulator [Microbacterium sp. KUDC0406]UJP09115.1 MarR family winged helix-turn-helix transcriptional regulator [Microbacterium sp. KUDC0406]